MLTVPILDACGQVASALEPSPSCAAVQPCSPSAAAGETVRPSGSWTTVRRSGGVPRPSGLSASGIRRSTVSAVGESAEAGSAETEMFALKRWRSQPESC
jgi:hypothetical protein